MPLKMLDEKKNLPLSGVKNVIGVAAGKGGVGKSTVTKLMAHSLAKRGFKVGVLDADVYGPSIRQMLPEETSPYQVGNIIYPAMSNGISLLSLAHFSKVKEAAMVRAPIANKILMEFIQNVSWGELDFLLIDFPPGTGDIQLTLSQYGKLSGVVLVTTPQEIAIMDVRKALHLFKTVNIPILGIIENMSYFLNGRTRKYLFGKDGGKILAQEERAPFLGEIPLNPEICQSCDVGQPYFLEDQIIRNFLDQLNQAKTIAIQNINQTTPYIFTIDWSDGQVTEHTLSDLQKKCPCALCGEQGGASSDDVEAFKVTKMGSYALKIEFTKGCSKGIYTYNQLRKNNLTD